MMARHLALIAAGAFSVSVMMAGTGEAVVCDPHCAPPTSNSGGDVRGLNRANAAAGVHGQHGRDKAADKQDLHKPGGSGVVSGGTGDESTTDTGSGETGGTTDTGGGVAGPCSGC